MLSAQDVKNMARELGADLVGIAAADRFGNAPQGYHPADVLPGCRSVVVLAGRWNPATMLAASVSPYWITRQYLSDKMTFLAARLAEQLTDSGALSVPIGSNYPDDLDPRTGRYRGTISLKHAAELAGLGRIGRNTLLINDRLGNALWLSAVVTEAQLESDPIADYVSCIPGCKLCVTACPVHALDGEQIDQAACSAYAYGERDGGEYRIHCFACRKACPNRFGLHLKSAGSGT